MKWLHCIVILIIIIQETSELVQNNNKSNSTKLRKCKKRKKQKPQSRIVHGGDAFLGQFPWNVVLKAFNPESGFQFECGGSIISATWVITASHCLVGKEIYKISVGSTRLYKQTQKQNTTKLYIHPNFAIGSPMYDIGLITFDIPLVMDAYVKPVALPNLTQSKKWFTGEQVTICGFGDDDDAGKTPENLQYVNLRVMHNDDCKPYFIEGLLDEQLMCAVGQQDKFESTCYGDSGGGAVIQIDNVPTIVGIASFLSPESCMLGLPNGFVRVGYHIDWISKTTGIKVLP